MLGINADRLGRYRFGVANKARTNNKAAICQRCCHNGQLQRCDQQEALPDAGNQRFARAPTGVIICPLPVAPRYNAGLFATHFNTRRLAKIEAARHFFNIVNAEPSRDFVIICVARLRDRVFKAHWAMAFIFPAVEIFAAKGIHSGAFDRFIRRYHPCLQCRQPDQHFEGGARRILPAQYFIHQRFALMCHHFVPAFCIHPLRQLVGIESRCRNHAQQITGLCIHDNGRPAVSGHAFVGEFLQTNVQRQFYIRARSTGIESQFAHSTPMRVNLHMAYARLAAQRGLKIALNPTAPDHI